MAEVTDYEKLEVKDLAKLVADRDLEVEGTGKDGADTKPDFIKALEANDAETAAEEKATADAAAAEKARDAGEPQFSVQRLIEDAYELTGYPRHYAAGALFRHNADDEMTAAAAKSTISRWLKGEVEG